MPKSKTHEININVPKGKRKVEEKIVYVDKPVIKEVLKEVPVIKEVVKEVPIIQPQPKPKTKIKEVVKEVPVIKEVEKIVIQEKPVEVIKQV